LREHTAKHPALEDVLTWYGPILHAEILKEFGVESEAAMKEALTRSLRQVVQAEQAWQELQQQVEDGERHLEIEVQNVKVRLCLSSASARLSMLTLC